MQLTTVVFLDVMEYGTTDSYLGVGGRQVSNYCCPSPEIKLDPPPEECYFSALKKEILRQIY